VGIDKYPRYPAQPETTDLRLLGARGRPNLAAPEIPELRVRQQGALQKDLAAPELRSSLVRPANEERPTRPLPFPGCVLLSAEGAIEYPPVDDRALRTLVHAVTGASPATAIDVHLADLAAALSVPTVPFRSG
jgi:hypothetical protein